MKQIWPISPVTDTFHIVYLTDGEVTGVSEQKLIFEIYETF